MSFSRLLLPLTLQKKRKGWKFTQISLAVNIFALNKLSLVALTFFHTSLLTLKKYIQSEYTCIFFLFTLNIALVLFSYLLEDSNVQRDVLYLITSFYMFWYTLFLQIVLFFSFYIYIFNYIVYFYASYTIMYDS